MPKFVSNVNLPESTSAGFNALTSPATQAYPYASNAPSNPGGALKRLTNVESGMQTVEYGDTTGTNGVQTIFSAAAGTSGVVEKIRITGGGNGMLNDWLQISYDGGATFPLIAELGTLFCAYPGGSGAVAGRGPWEASCAHLTTQQAATQGAGFYATHICSYPIPFTNGLLIQVFDPTQFAFSDSPYAEVTVSYCPVAQVPPYQLQCTGSNSGVTGVTISAMTFSGSTITATVPTTSFLSVGGNIQFNGTSGFTTNGPANTQTVSAILNATQFQFVNTAGTPTGSYTANSQTIYNWTTAQTPTWQSSNLTLDAANLPMYGSIYGAPAEIAYNQIAQLANITGFGGWAVGLAYTAKGVSGLTYLERNFGWYMDGVTAPTPTGTTTTPALIPSTAHFVITACTNTGTTVTASISSSSSLGVGQTVVISGVTGLTNVNGQWIITATGTGTFSFVAATTPTGSYTANSGTVFPSGSPYGTQVGSPSMQTTGTEDTFDSAYYNWNLTFPSGVNIPGSGVLSSVAATPVSGTTYTNPCGVPFDIYFQAVGPVSAVAINSTVIPMTVSSGDCRFIRIPPLGTVTLTFQGTAPSWSWVVSDYTYGGPLDGYSSPTAMGLGNGGTSHGGYYNAFLDILQSCGGYRFNSALQLWLLTESHVSSGDTHAFSWCLLYYKDLS